MSSFKILKNPDASVKAQRFATPSVFTDGTTFRFVEAQVVSLADRNGATIVDKATGQPRGYVAILTSASEDEALFLNALLRSRTGYDAKENIVTLRPQGAFVDEVRGIVSSLKDATLQSVCDALNGRLRKDVDHTVRLRSFFGKGDYGYYDRALRDIE